MIRVTTTCNEWLAMAPPSTQPGGGGGGSLFSSPLFLMVIIFVIFYFVVFRGKSKDQKKRKEMLANLRKNDRVMTIGGIVGHVVSVKDNEVVVKVDESSNTKMTFMRQAIQKVVTEDDEAGESGKSS